METNDSIVFDNSRPVERAVIDNNYKLYGGELSKQHPINIREDGGLLHIIEHRDNGQHCTVFHVSINHITNLRSLSILETDMSKRPWAAYAVINDIINYIKTAKGL